MRSEEAKPRPQLGKLAYAKIPTEFFFILCLFYLFIYLSIYLQIFSAYESVVNKIHPSWERLIDVCTYSLPPLHPSHTYSYLFGAKTPPAVRPLCSSHFNHSLIHSLTHSPKGYPPILNKSGQPCK